MRTLRTAVFFGCVVLLGGGYAASQWNMLLGQAGVYAKAVDSTPVKVLSTALLLVAIILQLWPDRESEENTA